jgi:hypothetical protein
MPRPTHPDGSNKRIGDMTAPEREAVMADARKRYRAEPEDDADFAAEAGDAEHERRRERSWED